ncbi:MAG: hypothetical protein KAK00_01265 [Nanoarchaeota archaeon]|nr:hypothetical protein [Nanoarchaeota archaeon]
MKANRKISEKTIAIIVLIAAIIFITVIPFETLVGKPSILGAVITKVYVRPIEVDNTCNITLGENWNLICIACQPENKSVDSVLKNISENYTSIHTYDASDTIDHWKSHNPDMPSWVIQDLAAINEKSGYWINMDHNSSLRVNGVISSPNNIPLIQGWNLIGYPADESKSPENAFSGISGSYSIVWRYNTSTGTYPYYDPNLAGGTIKTITKDRGYWINMTIGGTLWIT